MRISELQESDIGLIVTLTGRIHTSRMGGKSLCFIHLRDSVHSIQAIGLKKMLGDKFKPLMEVGDESVIILTGEIVKTKFNITSTSVHTMELQIHEYQVVSKAQDVPLQIDDINDSGETFRSSVGQALQLDHPWLRLRAPVNQYIFKIKSDIIGYISEFFRNNKFIQINTPKTIGVKSEGGANVFELNYFNQPAYLSQSPQLYKQTLINSDFERVFEIGPVFRAENCTTHRHQSEYTGIDFEMRIPPGETWEYVMNMAWNMISGLVNRVYSQNEVDVEEIRLKRPFDNCIVPNEPLFVTFKDAVIMLRDDGAEQQEFEDLNTENEKRLGRIVKEKYGSDLFILREFPSAERPFYTHANEPNDGYSRSYDIILRGEEIASGAQRINDIDMLKENIVSKGINPSTLSSYVQSFSAGSYPHGGCGFGLERIVMLILDLGNIRNATLFPRDAKRLVP